MSMVCMKFEKANDSSWVHRVDLEVEHGHQHVDDEEDLDRDMDDVHLDIPPLHINIPETDV